MISTRRCAMVIALSLTGCSWSNSMYLARRYTNQAIETDRRGRPFEAQVLWGQVLAKADSAWARSAESNFEARGFRGIAHARLGDCTLGVPDLESSLLRVAHGTWQETAHYELGRCDQKLHRPGAEDQLRGLLVSKDRDMRLKAAAVLADVYLDSRRWSDLLTLLPNEDVPGLRFARGVADVGLGKVLDGRQAVAPLLAARDTVVAWQRLLEVLATSQNTWTDSLYAEVSTFPNVSNERRGEWLLAGVRGAFSIGDTTVAFGRLNALTKLPPSLALDEARRLVAVYRISRAADLEDLVHIIRIIPPTGAEDGGPNSQVLALRRTADQTISEIDSLTGVPQGDLRLFAEAEDAQFVLGAPVLARYLRLRLAHDWPNSPYFVKSMLARLTFEPDSADAIRARLANYPRDAYVMVVHLQSDAPFTHLEDSLGTFIRQRTTAINMRTSVNSPSAIQE